MPDIPMLETLNPRPIFEINKAGDAPLRISVPEPPFGAFELGKCMVTDGYIGSLIYAFGKLLEILKLHADVKPVQHMLSLRHQLAMNGPQTSIAIGVRTVTKVVSFAPDRRSARLAELNASEPPLRTKAKRVAFPSSSSTLPAITSKLRSGRG
jgi:hypothetical protein